MPGLSDRAHVMPSSPIRRLMPSADKAVAKGVHIHHLNIGQPDIESPKEFWDAVEHSGLKVLEYSHSAGQPALRKRVAEHYRSIGIDVDWNQVLVCTAGSEALSFAFLSIMNPGDEVIVPEPLYANYLGFTRAADAKIVPITTRIEDGFALPAIEEFEKRITSKTKAILVCNPNNPTGSVYSDQQLEGLRELVIKHDLFLIADEVYREFNYTGRPIRSVLEMPGLEQNAIMADSVSKRFSLCGARIGFLTSRNAELNAAALKFAQARLSPPTLEQYGVLGAMETPAAYFEAVREEYMSRRDLLLARLRAMDGVECSDVHGAFYAMVRFPIDDTDRFCQWLLEDFSHNGQTVMLAPGTGFYETPGLGKDEARVAYVLGCERISEAVDCLEAALAAYPGRLARV